MAEWFWHSYPRTEEAAGNLVPTDFLHEGRKVSYAVYPQPGNEAVYEYLRKNPHKANLCHFLLSLDDRDVDLGSITEIDQELNLYDGILTSRFHFHEKAVCVITWVDPSSDTVCFHVDSSCIAKVRIRFAKPSHRIAGEEVSEDFSGVSITGVDQMERNIDGSHMGIRLHGCQWSDMSPLVAVSSTGDFRFTFYEGQSPEKTPGSEQTCRTEWNRFWESGGAVDFSYCTAPSAFELERRVVLSQYLTLINSTGVYPPAETGLFCNSWYGKFHLEMVPLHLFHFSLWNRTERILPVLDWYLSILPVAMEEARKNGYHGARWPKMTDPQGTNSPSTIATLLVWQQPHILFLLDSVFSVTQDIVWLRRFWDVIKETATFMVDFVTYDRSKDRYCLTPPIIPVQEVFDPLQTYNPSYECCAWSEGLETAIRLAGVLGEETPGTWKRVAEKMARPFVFDNLYMSAESNPDSFTAYAKDHPSMVFPLGFLAGKRIDRNIMQRTLLNVATVWDYSTLWGWDFAFLSMCATRLGMQDLAIDFLLAKTEKNWYAANGCNYQKGRKDLPSYLPGNGSLLMAVAMLCVGFQGCGDTFQGFPRDGKWSVTFENLRKIR